MDMYLTSNKNKKPVLNIYERIADANLTGYQRALRRGCVAHEIPVKALWSILRDKQAYRCVYCPRRIIFDFHLDHKLSLANRGGHTLHNLQFTCPWCNISKSSASRPLTLPPQFNDVEFVPPERPVVPYTEPERPEDDPDYF